MKKLCVLLILALLMSAALAETPSTPIHECGDYTYIILPDGTAQIVEWEGRDAELVIPAALDGLEVTSISECAFADCEQLRSIALPETVREIGVEAFAGCVDLEHIALPEGLLRIGDAAFQGCEALTRIALPASVMEIGENPFLACANLCEITVAEDSERLTAVASVLFSRADGRLVCYPLGLDAERYAVPEGVREIGARAFARDLYLEEVVLPESLEVIGRQAFDGCDGLQTMNLPASVTNIGDGAMRCARLTLVPEAGGEARVLAGDGA